MCHQRQPLNQRSHTRPYLGKNLRTVRILMSQPMHPLTIPTVIIGFWLYQTIKRLLHLAVANHYHPNTAHAAPLAVGGLEIYGCKILHISFLFNGNLNRTCHTTTCLCHSTMPTSTRCH